MSAPLRFAPRADVYHARRLSHTGERRGILLPDVACETYSDAVVLGRGQDKAMQAEVGDRILCEPVDFEPFYGDTGTVRDSELIGVIRAPDFAQVEPANDWVLLRPDPREWERVTEGGIVVTQGSLPGRERRLRERAYETYTALQGLLRSQRYREQPTDYDRWCMERDFWQDIPEEVRDACAEMRDQERYGESENRARPPLKEISRMCSGVVWGLGPDARTQAECGDRVCFGYFDRAVRLSANGTLLMLVKAECLDAVIPAEASVQIGMVAT